MHVRGLGPFELTSVAREVYADGGILAFYRGFFTNLVRTVPQAAVTLTSFEVIREVLSGSAGD